MLWSPYCVSIQLSTPSFVLRGGVLFLFTFATFYVIVGTYSHTCVLIPPRAIAGAPAASPGLRPWRALRTDQEAVGFRTHSFSRRAAREGGAGKPSP